MDSHRSLIAWQKCQALGIEIYRVTKTWPDDERFELTSQIRRAPVSSSSNIAEGYARRRLASKTTYGLLRHARR